MQTPKRRNENAIQMGIKSHIVNFGHYLLKNGYLYQL